MPAGRRSRRATTRRAGRTRPPTSACSRRRCASSRCAGVSTVVVSWWGRGSRRGPAAAAGHLGRPPCRARRRRAPGAVRRSDGGAHRRRHRVPARCSACATSTCGRPRSCPAADWRELNATLAGVRVFANTNLAGLAAAGGFDGLYTYDVLLFDGTLFPRLCAQARRLQLLCAPSVGPGYDARRATGDTRLKPRRNGATYDAMWRGAIEAGADIVTVTSYNEWHEGTQIEAGPRGPARLRELRRGVGPPRARGGERPTSSGRGTGRAASPPTRP